MSINRIFFLLIISICSLFLGAPPLYAAGSYGLSADSPLDYFESNTALRNIDNGHSLQGRHSSFRRTPSQEDIMIDVLDLKNMDIIDVLKLVAKKSGLNIVAGRDVKGKVSIYLNEVEVREALGMILESHNLTFVEENGSIRVMTAKDFQLKYGYKFGENLETRIVQLVYADAVEINGILNQMKSIVGRIIVDKSSNSIIIKDTLGQVDLLEGIISQVDVPRRTRIFELYYAKAADVSERIAESLTKNIGRVEVDERTNKLIVTDIPRKMSKIERLIMALDVKEKEVLIEAKIIQVLLKDEYKMGIDWEAIISKTNSLRLTSDFNDLDDGDKRGKISVGTLSDGDTSGYTAFIEAIETAGKTNILSNPRITVLNNQDAKILVGSTEPYITETTITPAAGAPTTSETVNFVEVGVKLYVTPTIHPDNFITMKIKPEVSAVTDRVGNVNKIPVVETSEAETVVVVKDGATIVIGGLIKDRNEKTQKRLPFLSKVPVVGRAFGNVHKLYDKSELVIFIKPKIVTGEGMLHQEQPLLDMADLMAIDEDEDLDFY